MQLNHALLRTSPPWSACQQRHLAFISNFTCSPPWVRKLWNLNLVECILFQPTRFPSGSFPLKPISSNLVTHPSLYFTELVPLQPTCSSIQSLKNSTSLKIISVPYRDTHLLCNISSGTLRPIVPTTLRRNLFELLNSAFHPGIRGSRRLVSSKFVCPKMSIDVGSWVRACH